MVLDVTVAIRSPFLFQGLDPAAYGYDSSALRGEGGAPIIPGDHLRGHLRHAIKTIAEVAPNGSIDASLADKLFGKMSQAHDAEGGGEQDKPNRGLLIISDLVGATILGGMIECGAPGSVGAPYPRVKIDENTGAAADGMLQTIELVAPIDAVVIFRGEIVVRPGVPDGIDIAALLDNALQLVPAMGALKSSGFGEIDHERSTIRRAQRAPVAPPLHPRSDRLAITVAFDRPLLINTERAAGNYYSGATIVPGGAIKGVLAEALIESGCQFITERGDPDGEAFSRLIISHAFPLTKTGELADRAIPDSLATVLRADRTIELREMADPLALDALIKIGTPALPLDWKREVLDHVRTRVNRPNAGLKHLPRGRVAISEETGVAAQGQLFVVSPVGTRGRHWRFTLDRNGGADSLFERVVALIAAGSIHVGRTGARMTVVEGGICAASEAPAAAPRRVGDGDAFVILLETPAVLTDPDDERSVHDQYEAAFRALSGTPDIRLITHFARRSLYGRYVGFRFRAFGPNRYQPFEVTEPGAVFVLAPDANGKVAAWLTQAARTGLAAVGRHEDGSLRILDDWRVCPFVPQNGYGAITLNADFSRV